MDGSTLAASPPYRSECATLLELSEDNHLSIFEYLRPYDQLRLGTTCKEMALRCEDALASPTLILEGAEDVTDGFLKWLLRRLPRGTLKKLVLSNCTQLSRAGVTRALRIGRSTNVLVELSALHVGSASWSVDELHWLVGACPSLRILHADCRANGVDQLGLLPHDQLALRPRKLVLHSARTASAAGDAAEAEAETAGFAATVGPQVGAAEAPHAGVGADPAASTSSAEPRISPLGAALQRCKGSLQELDARGDVLDEDSMDHVSSLLSAQGSALRRLLLPGASALVDQMTSFADALSTSSLEQLQLGCASINASVCQTLATALPHNRSLRNLELQHCPLLDAGATALANALASNRALHSLRIPFTGVGDSAISALAAALRQGSALHVLDLSGNQFTAIGVSDLASALKVAPQLEWLSLSANARVGAPGAVALANALPDTGLISLHLEGCAIGATPCGRLADALAASKVEEINLSSNEIGDQGAWELAWRLPDCTNLTTLHLAVNEIEEDGASELLSGLSSNLLAASVAAAKAAKHLTQPSRPSSSVAPAAAGMRMLDLRGNRIPERSQTFAALQALGRANMAFQRNAYGM